MCAPTAVFVRAWAAALRLCAGAANSVMPSGEADSARHTATRTGARASLRRALQSCPHRQECEPLSPAPGRVSQFSHATARPAARRSRCVARHVARCEARATIYNQSAFVLRRADGAPQSAAWQHGTQPSGLCDCPAHRLTARPQVYVCATSPHPSPTHEPIQRQACRKARCISIVRCRGSPRKRSRPRLAPATKQRTASRPLSTRVLLSR